MPYLQIDDNYAEHPKIEALSDLAFRIHTAALCHCARLLTDGRISAKTVAKLTASTAKTAREKAVNELVNAPLWHPNGDGYVIHDYLDWNPSREDVIERREALSQAGKRGAKKRWGNTKRRSQGNSPGHNTPHSPGHSQGDSSRARGPLPSSLPPNPRTAGEQESDLEPLTPREARTNPRAVAAAAKADRAHAAHVTRTVALAQQWLSEPDATLEGVTEQIRCAYPDIADAVLTQLEQAAT